MSSKTYYALNRAACLEYQQKYREANPEKYKTIQKKAQKKYYEKKKAERQALRDAANE